jgi:hypothetical protein
MNKRLCAPREPKGVLATMGRGATMGRSRLTKWHRTFAPHTPPDLLQHACMDTLAAPNPDLP